MYWKKAGHLSPILLPMITFFMSMCWAESPEVVERHVKSAFIYQFTKYITWPVKNGDFVITVIDDPALQAVLKDMTEDKTAGDRPIKIRDATLANAAEGVADILVFPKKNLPAFNVVIDKVKSKPCLVIGHADGMAAAGATINFFMDGTKMKFELNQKSLKAKRLEINDALLKLAKLVE